MTGEQDVFADLVAQVEASVGSIRETLELLDPFPTDVADFAAMTGIRRVAATALLKEVEQLEDGLARSFRTMLRMLGQNLKGLYPYDIATHMIDLGVIDDADRWVAIVKLRNELVHEYPASASLRWDRLVSAYRAVAFLRDAAARLAAAARSRKLMP